jgi:hypothetical protein
MRIEEVFWLPFVAEVVAIAVVLVHLLPPFPNPNDEISWSYSSPSPFSMTYSN